jgi:putative MATE family efflux protein
MNLALDLAVVRRVLVLGAPVILAMLSQTAINIADTIFVGHLTPAAVATDGQSAIGISMPLFWMFGGFCAALGVGTQAIVARRHGERDPEAAGAVLANSLILTLILSAVATVAGLLLLPTLFALMHGDPHVQELGVDYSRWRFLGILSMVGTFSYKAFYDGTERTWVHLAAAMVMNVTNVVLDWALVFGELGLPRMEVGGAGLASMIASYAGLGLMLLFTLRRGDRTRYRPYRWRNCSARQVWAIAKLSIPSGAATVVVMIGMLMVLKVVAHIDELVPQPGSVQTAATKIIMDIMSVCFIGTLGLGTATATLVSKSLGEKNPELAERYGWQSIKFGAYVFGVLGLLELLFPDVAIGLFNRDPAVIDAARDSLRLMGAVEAMMAAAIIATQCLFGAGNTRFVMYAETALHFGLLIPLSYVFGVLLGLEVFGVWIAVACYATALAAIMMIKFRSGSWKTIRI